MTTTGVGLSLAEDQTRHDIYWDTCLFYEFFGGEKNHLSPTQLSNLRGVMREVEQGKFRIVTSLLTQLEVVPSKMEAKASGADARFLAAFKGGKMKGVEVSPNVIIRARQIRDYYYVQGVEAVTDEAGKIIQQSKAPRYMDLGDCIHVATATLFGIRVLHTRDGTAKRKGKKRNNVSLIEVGAASKGMICGKWPLTIKEPEPEQSDMFDG